MFGPFALLGVICLMTPLQDAHASEGSPLTVHGDVRFRFEADDRLDDGADQSDMRTRPRLRARLGTKYRATDSISLGIRLATIFPGETNPGHSPHQTLDYNDTNVLTVDRAYIQWEVLEGGSLVLGKQGNPNWQQTEVFWDGDIQPEGYAFKYKLDIDDNNSINANLGYFYLDNNGWRKNWFKNDAFSTWHLKYSGKLGSVSPVLAATGMHMRDAADQTNVNGSFDFNHTDFLYG